MSTKSWTVISAYFEKQSLIQQQIESYNVFVETGIQKVIDSFPLITAENDDKKCIIKFGKISLSQPTFTESDGLTSNILPHDARMRNLTYASSLYVEVEVDNNNEKEIFKRCFLGKVPVMVKSKFCNLNRRDDSSGECKNDYGGYFIVGGSEKVLIAQEKMNNNQVYVFSKSSLTSKVILESEIRSLNEHEIKSTSTLRLHLMNYGDGDMRLHVQLPFIKSTIPAISLFRLFGVEYSDIATLFDDDVLESLYPSFIECNKDTYDNITSKFVNNTIENYVFQIFPNLDTIKRKTFMFAHMIAETMNTFQKKRKEDDRDHFKNKRIDSAGDLMAGLFRQLYKKVHKEISTQVQKNFENSRMFNLTHIIKSKIVSNGLKYALATGNWGIGSVQGVRAGVSQVLNRHSYLSTLSHLRRINSPVGKEGKITLPRQLHGSHAYRICPCETPEGGQCGLVKNMALLSLISFGSPSEVVINALPQFEVKDLNLCEKMNFNETKVFVNGFWVGYHTNPHVLTEQLRALKRNCDFSPETSIVFDRSVNTIRIAVDSGRCLRPLMIINPETKKPFLDHKVTQQIENKELTWNDLMSKGYIEYVDADEEENTLIAFDDNDINERDVDFTHCEIHPAAMLGICAIFIPYANHNQSPRNIYQSAMGKQAMGLYATNYRERFDSYAHVLLQPQKPLVRTKAYDTFNFDETPTGMNAIVAIACYGGFNQEDSIIMNKSSVDRGMFRSLFIRTYTEQQRQHGSSCKEIIEKPLETETVGLKYGNYKKLDHDGIASPGEKLCSDDIVIGKTTTLPTQTEKHFCKKDSSTMLRHNEEGTVDSVMVSTNEQGMQMVKSKVRSYRIPEVGDKFASCHAQKGTIGITLRHEDMPFTEEGIVPDIIMNPHALPSRMTIGQLIECVAGKTSALTGEFSDCTPFDHEHPEVICKKLKQLGYDEKGKETMYCGYTGEQLKAKIFIGPTYYQRLKHMVRDKQHSRAKGPVQILTRQPVEGRARAGGLRFGEMERDAIIGHGAALFLKERLMDQSDIYRTCVCKVCGIIGIDDAQKSVMTCKACKSKENVDKIEIPYACKLLFQELMSMNIVPKMILK